jgi:hypothetical protein
LSTHRHTRGYALILVLMILALLSVGLGTLFVYQEGSANTTGSLLERRRVFYACDGIGRAATVLAQSYMTTAAPTTPGLITAVCTEGGGGCCATTTDTSGSPIAGACETSAGARFTRLLSDPAGPGATALPLITPTGFKIAELTLSSEAKPCVLNSECVDGTCSSGFCRTVAPLPNGPFQGMNARQDTITMGVVAEHTATTRFRCSTEQTLTLGKIAMFQFFLFSDSAYTDWHPGPMMRASGRLHANGDLGLGDGSALRLERLTAAGTVSTMGGANGSLCTALPCTAADVRIANRVNPTMTNDTHFTVFRRTATWQTQALTDYANGNAQDSAHGVPRLQLPIVGIPEVQQGFTAANGPIPNTNALTVNGVPRQFSNSRLLVDPVRAADSAEIREQKFAHKADIRIINGAWYLKNPLNANDWPGVIIWSDHGVHAEAVVEQFRTSATNIGQQGLAGLEASLSWASRIPQRFSYYGVQLGNNELSRDLPNTAAATLRPVGASFTQTAVVSYGALFRDATAGQHAAVWRPGVRTLQDDGRQSWCEPYDGADTPVVDMLDALAVSAPAGNPCTEAVAGAASPTQAAALLAATRSGFRDGFAEMQACGTNDDVTTNPTNCDANPLNTEGDRRRGNILPMNFDLAAFQEALADTTPGELGSYFCAPGVPTCGAFMTRPFNGIVYIAAPYPGSERGYAASGGNNTPAQLPIPGRRNDVNGAAIEQQGVNLAGHLNNLQLAAGRARHDAGAAADDVSWPNDKAMPILLDRGNDGAVGEYEEARDDEVAALPYPLCSDSATPVVLTTGGYQFVRPDCGNDTTFTRINGVRIINARRVNSNTPPIAAPDVAEPGFIPAFPTAPVLSAAALGRLPKGISIISNLPVYVVGDVNITSDAWDDPANNRPWVPVLIGGDVVHLLSNFWNDTNARWAESNGQQTRRAMVTRYYMEMLSGWGMSVAAGASGGIHNFPRALENWGSGTAANCRGTGDFSTACPAIIRGSMVIGHNRVYTSWRFVDGNGQIGRSPPRRDWGFDDHLLDLEKQPPGTPLFDVAAVKQWSRH